MQEKNTKEVRINVEEKVKLNFTDVLLIVTTFGVIFFIGMFSTVMSNWQIILISIPNIFCGNCQRYKIKFFILSLPIFFH